jgi:two-component system LytT family response regulator
MRDFFFLKTNGKCAKIFFKELQYVEAVDKCVRIVTEKKSYLVLGCLYQVEEWLPPNEFCRIHRSYLVSLRHINEFSNDLVSIVDRELPIGNQYRPNFLDRTDARCAETISNSKGQAKKVLIMEPLNGQG